jgi:prepilin-type N-terminal cleavage/methylation domain-containing protein
MPEARIRGFSLLEMLLSVAIIGMLAGVSLPLYNSFLARNDLDIAAQQVAETLRRAQIYARGMKNDSAWSVERPSSTTVVLFRGINYGGRDTAYDEPVSLNGITASGLSEVQFAKLTGLPNTTGSITLTTNVGETKTVTINAQGMVEY